MYTHKFIDTPLGRVTLVNRNGKLAGLYLEDHSHMPDPATFGDLVETGFDDTEAQLAEYFAGARTEFDLETDAQGNDFQKKVWTLLKQIPYGQTRSYSQLAEQLGDRKLARAVGSADARNPLSIIVPCHRVVAANGALTGYAGGLDRKRQLLDLEAGVLSAAG